MSVITLESLLEEYRIVSMRRTAIEGMIVAYGGNIPDNYTKPAAPDYMDMGFIGNLPLYPKTGTWKEKIVYAVQRVDSMTSGEICNYIMGMEPDVDKALVVKNVVQTASAMAIGDKAVLEVTKVGRKNQYSIKQ